MTVPGAELVRHEVDELHFICELIIRFDLRVRWRNRDYLDVVHVQHLLDGLLGKDNEGIPVSILWDNDLDSSRCGSWH